MDDDRAYTDAVPFPKQLVLRPIGRVRSPWKQRHGTPRQPGLRSAGEGGHASGRIELFPDVIDPLALRHLERFDRIWVIAWMHLNGPRRRPLVRPPRGGPKRGVLATRSPHRPNPLALSAFPLLRIEGTTLHVADLDLLDHTPILDVKPYIAAFDAHPHAGAGWLDEDAPGCPGRRPS